MTLRLSVDRDAAELPRTGICRDDGATLFRALRWLLKDADAGAGEAAAVAIRENNQGE